MRTLRSACFAFVCFTSGCATSESPAEVSGTVLMDGKPMPEGEIIFEATDNSKTPAAGAIRDGKYTAHVVPGPKKVKIQGSRTTSNPDPVMGTAAREATLGSEYNEKSTLTAEINAGKNDGVDFQVKEQPRKK